MIQVAWDGMFHNSETYHTFYIMLALTRKICGILSKKLQKLSLLKLLSNLSVKTTVFCYFFDIPQILNKLLHIRNQYPKVNQKSEYR